MMFSPYPSFAAFQEECGYMIDGTWYPRVTKIVSIKAKPALYRYYAQSPDMQTAENVSRRAAEEGSAVHAAAQAMLLGRSLPSSAHDIAPAISALARFLEKKKVETDPALIEKRIVHKTHRYAGTVDAVVRIGRKLGVLDIKTSSSIYRDYNLQTAAYLEALRGEIKDIEARWILRIDQYEECERCGARRRTKGGDVRIRQRGPHLCSSALGHAWAGPKGEVELRETRNWERDFEAFLGAKRLWEWEHESWLRKLNLANEKYDILKS